MSSTVDAKPFYGNGRSRSHEQLPQQFMSAPNQAGNFPPSYSMDFTSMNNLSVMNFDYGQTSSSTSTAALQAPGNSSTFANGEQFPQFDPQADMYPSGNFGNFNETMSPPAAQTSNQYNQEQYLDNTGFADMSQYNTPGINDSMLEAQFGSALNLDNSVLSTNGDMSSPLQAQEFSDNANGFQANYSNHTSPYPGSMVVHPSISPAQLSPPLGSSPAASSAENLSTQRQQMLSPTITIENVGRDESPRRSRARRSGSKRSNTHLSPYPDDYDSSEDEMDDVAQESPQQINCSLSPAQRDDEGAWVSQDQSGLSGLGPDARKDLDLTIPTLDEIDKQRELNERNANVEDWLAHSEVGSETGDFEGAPKKHRRKRFGRPRARSTNDAFSRPGAGLGVTTLPDPYVVGPGVLINEPSEMDFEDGDDTSGSESPPADVTAFNTEDYLNNEDSSSGHSRPWADPEPLPAPDTPDSRSQPPTANAAMMRFKQRAQELDTASLAATIGSGRRRSESDLGSVVHAAGISKVLTLVETGKPTERKGTLFSNFKGSILPNRSGSGKLKRKGSHTSSQPPQKPENKAEHAKEQQPNLSPPKRMGSFGRPKSPKLDTNVSGAGHESRSPISGIVTHARGFIRRSRSRSDLGKSPKSAPGLADLWTQHGGPPVAMLASPSASHPQRPTNTADVEDESGEDEVGPDGVVMDLTVRTDVNIIPTYDGFKYHARQLNPRIKDYLLERLTQEQLKRYKRLLESKSKHAQAVANHSCGSKNFCFALGGDWKPLPPRLGGKDPDATLVGFQIMAPGMTEEDLETRADGQVIAAQFPSGVPLPPVKTLPAEFECPLCFKVKKFHKPSDWTKHVHEDVQPFTCTFPNCTEPKSFKRKADWVRHENERHRQLECWTCNIGECSHTCYRKDNFVQHLVREHKVPEPRVRTGGARGSRSPITPLEPASVGWPGLPLPSNDPADCTEDVWALVEKCRKDASKNAREEPCRFCGNICSSWKKLTVHLAKHMEQISMPALGLIELKRYGAPVSNFAPVMSSPAVQNMPIRSTIPVNELPTGILCAEPSEIDSDSPAMATNGVASQFMQTYPPPNMNSIIAQAQAHGPTSAPFVGTTYPPPMVPSTRSRSTSFNEAQHLSVPSQHGTSYPPVGMQSRQVTPHMDQAQGFLSPQSGYGTPRIVGVQNQFLTPPVGTPDNYGYAQDDSMQTMQRQMGMPQQGYPYGG